MSWFVQIPEELRIELGELRQEQLRQGNDEILQHENAARMWCGLGGASYLTMDGRVLIYDDFDDKLREATNLQEVVRSLATGARQHGLPDLLELLPRKPPIAADCDTCEGTRYYPLPRNQNQYEDRWMLCPSCHGLGWIQQDKSKS